MQSNSEIEITVYAKIGDATGLAQAEYSEEHVQLQARMLEDGVKTRVRKTTPLTGNEPVPEYLFTVKRKNPNQDYEGEGITDSTEYDCVVNADFFETFKQAAENCLLKTRYYFKHKTIHLKVEGIEEPLDIPDVGFEVDVFKNNGAMVEYVKIDLEVDKIIAYLTEHHSDIKDFNLRVKFDNLPFKPTDIIYKPTATEEQKAFIHDLWENHYTLKREQLLAL